MVIDCFYSPHKSEKKKHLAALRNYLDLHSSECEKILILGYFNLEIEKANMKSFWENYNLKNLINNQLAIKILTNLHVLT